MGHLLQVFLLVHLQRAGGAPVIVIGGATGMIGDPSGKSSERKLLDDATIQANAAALQAQLSRFVDFSPGPAQALVRGCRLRRCSRPGPRKRSARAKTSV